MATIKDVAQAAGVSITTVSHVVNGSRRVSDRLTQRVLEAMEALDYRPNILARSLRLGETKTLGLVIPDNSNLFFAEMARSIEDTGYRNGYSVILCNSDGDVEKQQSYVRLLVDKQVDGMVFISSGESSEDLQYLTDEGIEVVIVDRDVPNMPVDVILLDNEQAGYEATRYLIDLGHRLIACVTGPSQLTPSAQRVNGYRRALQEAGIAFNPDYLTGGDFQLDGGEQATGRLLALDPRPSAVFVCNDMMAIGAIRGARNLGLGIPQDLSVIGFDDIALATAIYPALTTMAQPIAEMARIATELLIERIQGQVTGEKRQRILLSATLKVRESCAPPER